MSLVNTDPPLDTRVKPFKINGRKEAELAAKYWKNAVEHEDVPLPDAFYASPMLRAIETLVITWQELTEKFGHEFRPIIKAGIAEQKHLSPYVRNQNLTGLKATLSSYPYISFQGVSSLPICDTLWLEHLLRCVGGTRGTEHHQEQYSRISRVLDDIFADEKSAVVSITAHHGTSKRIMEMLGLDNELFGYRTGQIYPIVVQGKKRHGKASSTSTSTPTYIFSSSPTASPSSVQIDQFSITSFLIASAKKLGFVTSGGLDEKLEKTSTWTWNEIWDPTNVTYGIEKPTRPQWCRITNAYWNPVEEMYEKVFSDCGVDVHDEEAVRKLLYGSSA